MLKCVFTYNFKDLARLNIKLFCTVIHQQQSGKEEARWVHNPEFRQTGK